MLLPRVEHKIGERARDMLFQEAESKRQLSPSLAIDHRVDGLPVPYTSAVEAPFGTSSGQEATGDHSKEAMTIGRDDVLAKSTERRGLSFHSGVMDSVTADCSRTKIEVQMPTIAHKRRHLLAAI